MITRNLGKVIPEKGVDYFTEADISEIRQGMQEQITSNNKLAADLVDDTNATNKFVTATQKTNWNTKQDKIANILTSNLNYSDGTTPALLEGYYFTGNYTVNINNEEIFPNNTYFYCIKFDFSDPIEFSIIMLLGTSTMEAPVYVNAKYNTRGNSWQVDRKSYLLDNNITTTINSSSTNTQVAGAKAVYDFVTTQDFVSSETITAIWKGSQADYDLIDPKSPTTMYIIEEEG